MTDPRIIYAVVVGLAATVLIAMIGGITLAVMNRGVPDFLIAMGTTSLGALASILVRTSTERPVVSADDAEVNVTTSRKRS